MDATIRAPLAPRGYSATGQSVIVLSGRVCEIGNPHGRDCESGD